MGRGLAWPLRKEDAQSRSARPCADGRLAAARPLRAEDTQSRLAQPLLMDVDLRFVGDKLRDTFIFKFSNIVLEHRDGLVAARRRPGVASTWAGGLVAARGGAEAKHFSPEAQFWGVVVVRNAAVV